MRFLVALGSNLGAEQQSPRDLVRRAITSLVTSGFSLVARSGTYLSPAQPAGSGPDFINAAVALDADLTPQQALEKMHDIEALLSRVREYRWAPRTIDLDLLAAGSMVYPDAATVRKWIHLPPEQQMAMTPDELLLPHPRMQDRAFVLGPLREFSPNWQHPLLNRSVEDMWAALPAAARDSLIRLPE